MYLSTRCCARGTLELAAGHAPTERARLFLWRANVLSGALTPIGLGTRPPTRYASCSMMLGSFVKGGALVTLRVWIIRNRRDVRKVRTRVERRIDVD